MPDLGELEQSLSALEFLRDKELAGDLVTSTGLITGAAPLTVAFITPAAGKTFFIAKSSHVFSGNVVGGGIIESELQNDGTVKDIKRAKVDNVDTVFIDGTIVGDSLVGDGVKTYRIQKTVGIANLDVAATLMGWIQDT